MRISRLLFRNKKDKTFLNQSKDLLNSNSFKILYRLFVLDKLYFAYNHVGVSSDVVLDSFFPQAYISKEKHQKHLEEVQKINDEIKANFFSRSFREFSKKAPDFIKKKYCDRINGYEPVKKAIILMLVSDKDLNILIVGNKEEKAKDLFVDCIRDIYSDGVFGRGSDLLGLRYDMDGYHSGLIPKADGKLLCLKDFEDMNGVDAEFFKIAMDKKVIFIAHEDKSFSEDANMNVLAVASTKELRFVSNSPDILNQQVPINKDVQSYFHLRFICRNITRNLSGLKEISDNQSRKSEDFTFNRNSNDSIMNQITALQDKNVVDEQEYIKKYISYAQKIDVSFNEKLNDHIVHFSEKLDTLYDPRKFVAKPDKENIVKLVMRLAKANAKLGLRRDIIIEDLMEAEMIVTYSLLIN
jgi:DNA replicative helicase MCM subunit Mcm2 (Cdc46/Mcm family)